MEILMERKSGERKSLIKKDYMSALVSTLNCDRVVLRH